MSGEAPPGGEPPPPHLLGLNPEQYDAVTTVEGPLLILAGAGSGKTRVLTRRVAHLLHLGVAPTNILAVTFTNKAAAEMKERVVELVGDVGDKVWVSTFHSTCGRILRADIEPIGFTRRFSIYDDDDQIRVIKQVFADQGLSGTQDLTPQQVLRRIDVFKCQTLTVGDVLRQQRSHINNQLMRIWRDYEAQLQAADALDFNDLIGHVVRLFGEHPDVLAKWRGRFHYVLVDEYQDTNVAQYRLLRALTEEHHNLAVVGDDDQSIYGFRGADITNILNFERDHPNAKIVRLEQNYRSTKNILDVANAVVVHNEGRIDKKLWTDGAVGVPVNFIECTHQRDEAPRVVRAIQALVARRDFRYADIAVIYRTNRASQPFERELQRAGIPYRVVGGRKFYERREVRDVLAFLRLVVNPADDAAFLRVVNVPSRGIGAKTLAELRAEATTRGQPLLRTARAAATGSGRPARAFRTFVEIVDEATELARDAGPAELVAWLLDRTGYRAMLDAEASPDSQRRLENLDELALDALRQESDAALTGLGPVEVLQAWLDRVALTGSDDELPDGGHVTLMTVHSSKGLEYPAVFVVNMNEGSFPHVRSLERGIDEERRLAYVAFTRARTHLFVSFSHSQRRPGSPRDEPLDVSRFIVSLPRAACHNPPTPTPAGSPTDPRDVRTSKLRTFLQHHTPAPERAPLPAADLTFIELEELDQLAPRTRVFHERYGLGVVERLSGTGEAMRVLVSFAGRTRALPLRGIRLQIVVD